MGSNREGVKAEKVSYEGFDVKVFRDGSEILEDIWIVEAKHLKHEVFKVTCGGQQVGRKSNSGEVVEVDPRGGGRDGGNVTGSGGGVIRCDGDEDVN